MVIYFDILYARITVNIKIMFICGALRDLVPFLQFKKREKHPWRSANFSNVASLACNFTKFNTPPWVFFTFLNCRNGTKSRNASHLVTKLDMVYSNWTDDVN